MIDSFDGTEIHFDFYDAPSPSLVLVVPGFWRDRRYPSMQRLGRMLNAFGYRVAILDARGHGDSGGTYGFNFREHHDVQRVAEELLAGYGISAITLLGFSVGGAIAVSTAARHPQLPIRSLLLISPVAEFSRIVPKINLFHLHRHIAVSQAMRRPRFDWMFARSEKLSAAEDISSVKVPVSLIHVKNDWLIHHSHSERLFARANEPRQLHLLEIAGRYHADRIFSVAPEAIEPLVIDFLRTTLGVGR